MFLLIVKDDDAQARQATATHGVRVASTRAEKL
jgi:hypothetical protein